MHHAVSSSDIFGEHQESGKSFGTEESNEILNKGAPHKIGTTLVFCRSLGGVRQES